MRKVGHLAELRYQPVSEWLKRWLDDCRESIAESTLVRYTAVVRHACQFFDEKGLALCRVSPMAMEEYRDAMLACGYSARTIQMHFKLLQTAFTAACSYGLNRSNQSVVCSCRAWNAIFRVRTLPQNSKSCWRN